MYDILEEYSLDAFTVADPERVTMVAARLVTPANDFTACSPVLEKMNPDLDVEALKANWGWKIRYAAVIRFVREALIPAMDPATLLATVAIDHSAFNALVEEGAISVS